MDSILAQETERAMKWLRILSLATLSVCAGLPGRANADVPPPDEGCDCSVATRRSGSGWLLGGTMLASAVLLLLRRRHRR